MCGNKCQYLGSDPTPPAASYVQDFSATEQLFLQASARLGYGFTGAPLAAPRLGSDGNYQMVFENVVLYIDPIRWSPDQVKTTTFMAWDPGLSQPVKAVEADWLSFYPTQDGPGLQCTKFIY